MGNNRLQLKEKIAQNLREKIEGTKKILSGLEGALTDVHRNSAKAQAEIQASADDLCKLIHARKSKLIGQIEELSLAQGSSLQESIQQNYLDLGRLQGTLFQIDSFDMGQLANVQFQELEQMITIPPPVKTSIDSSAIKNEISKWGSVYVDLAASDSQRNSYSNLANCPSEQMVASNNAAFSNQTLKETNALDFDVDLWLSEIKAQTSSENEDFEMLFVEDSGSLGSNIPVEEEVKVSPTCATPEKKSVSKNEDDSSSSIVCMDSEESVEEDLSKWLKPKKLKVETNPITADLSKWLKPRNNNLSSVNSSSIFPQEVLQSKGAKSNPATASKTQFLDFPCLRLDPKCWLHKKVSKENINYNLRADFTLELSEKQIIPPTYALPYPFWLKKC